MLTRVSEHRGVSFVERDSGRGARKGFVPRIREIVAEYTGAGLGPTAAMAEIKAALRELDRRAPEGQANGR